MGLATAKYLGVAVNSSDTAVTNLKEQMEPLVDPLKPARREGRRGPGAPDPDRRTARLLLDRDRRRGDARRAGGAVLATVLYVRRATNRLALDVLARLPGAARPRPGALRGPGPGARGPHRPRRPARRAAAARRPRSRSSSAPPCFAVSALDTVEGEGIGTATAFGVYLTGLAAAGLVSLGFLAFRDARVRRYVGILWDVATFWPRANHPLTPPCYGERAVPELARRTAAMTSGAEDLVILSAHSQGSVLAAAMLMRPQPGAGRVALLTYGAPLRRLYARFFPAYFGPGAFSDVQTNTQGRWLNLWAPSDPIGAWVLTGRGPSTSRCTTRAPSSPTSTEAAGDVRPLRLRRPRRVRRRPALPGLRLAVREEVGHLGGPVGEHGVGPGPADADSDSRIARSRSTQPCAAAASSMEYSPDTW